MEPQKEPPIKPTIDQLKKANAAEAIPSFTLDVEADKLDKGKARLKLAEKLRAIKEESAVELDVPPLDMREPPLEPFMAEMVLKLDNYHKWMMEEVFPRLMEKGHIEAMAEYQEQFQKRLLLAGDSPSRKAIFACSLGAALNQPNPKPPNEPRYYYSHVTKLQDMVANKSIPMEDIWKGVPEELITGQGVYFTEEFRDVALRTLRYMNFFASAMWHWSGTVGQAR